MKPVATSWWAAFAGLALVVSACVSEPRATSDAAAVPTEPTTTVGNDSVSALDDEEVRSNDSASTTDPVPLPDTTDVSSLPIRQGPRERTTESVPHMQLDAVPVPEVDVELRRRAFSIPSVEDEPSAISLAGARALWISEDIDLTQPEILLSGREFAHIHPDGSLHVWLPVERAVEVEEAAWGELHPWVDRDDFWDGVAMIFTPETLDEVDVVMQLLVESYNYVSGLDLDPNAF